MLLLSSSRREVRLWDVSALDSGPACGWDDCRGGHFNHAGTVVAAVSSRQTRCSYVISAAFSQGCEVSGKANQAYDHELPCQFACRAAHSCASTSLL